MRSEYSIIRKIRLSMPFDRAWEKVSCPKLADNIGNNNDNSKNKS